MTDATVTQIVVQMMIIGAKLAAPMLLTSLLVGVVISMFQAVTQLQDSTLSAVPKMIAVGVALVLSANWMLSEMVSFTQQMFALVPQLVSG